MRESISALSNFSDSYGNSYLMGGSSAPSGTIHI